MAGENQPLAGRVAIVTGAGIGAGIATALAEAGAAVAVADIDEASAAATARVIEGKDRPVIAVRADVSEARDVRAMVERALAGGVDILCDSLASA
jgi:3-hydroxybutyrate dehydrogenase